MTTSLSYDLHYHMYYRSVGDYMSDAEEVRESEEYAGSSSEDNTLLENESEIERFRRLYTHKIFRCSICGFTCYRPSNLEKHQNDGIKCAKIIAKIKRVSEEFDIRRLLCNEIFFKYTNEADLNLHFEKLEELRRKK